MYNAGAAWFSGMCILLALITGETTLEEAARQPNFQCHITHREPASAIVIRRRIKCHK